MITYSCQGDDLLVETKISGEATMLSVPIYTLDGSYREVWRGDRLISFDSRVDDNGEKFEVSARAEGDQMVIDRRRGMIEAPATIVSDHPWNFAVLDRTLLFDSRRGKLRHVRVEPAGEETLTIGGREVSARKIQHDRRSRARAVVRQGRHLAAVAARVRRRQGLRHLERLAH